MKTLYLECNMGAAGDMLTAALLELYHDKEGFLHTMNHLGLPGVTVSAEKNVKCGIAGTHLRVLVRGQEEHSHDHGYDHDHDQDHEHSHDHDHEHEHSHWHDHDHDHSHDHTHGLGPLEIDDLIDRLPLDPAVLANAKAVYHLIAQAEATVHDKPVSDIHFHEVGTLDAVADVVGCCLLFHLLGPNRVVASPVHVGSGFVRCAHGILPVPAPATALLLRGIPSYGGEIHGELCTPTGAALLRHFVSEFGPMPVMSVQSIGYGMGTKDFPAANCVRAFWSVGGKSAEGETDEIDELTCNLDDMTPEALGFAAEALFSAGALDVFTVPATMKKGRPAFLLTVLCRPADRETLTLAMLAHTTTLGVRASRRSRRILSSHFSLAETPYGAVRVKHSHGHGVFRIKPEFESVRTAALAHGVPFETVYQAALKVLKINESRKFQNTKHK